VRLDPPVGTKELLLEDPGPLLEPPLPNPQLGPGAGNGEVVKLDPTPTLPDPPVAPAPVGTMAVIPTGTKAPPLNPEVLKLEDTPEEGVPPPLLRTVPPCPAAAALPSLLVNEPLNLESIDFIVLSSLEKTEANLVTSEIIVVIRVCRVMRS
jgi:hypothetical protein